MLFSGYCLLFILGNTALSEKIKVLKTTDDLSTFKQTSGGHIIFPPHTVENSVTLCLRFVSNLLQILRIPRSTMHTYDWQLPWV